MAIPAKIGCAPQNLIDWVEKAEVDSGKLPDVSSEMAESVDWSRSDQLIWGII